MKTRLSPLLLSVLFLVFLVAGLPLRAASPDSGAKGARAAKSGGGVKVDYLLQPEDQLRVFVFQEDDINKQGEVSISQEYTITLPMIGTINVKGMTARDAEEKIRAAYDKDYLVKPQVTVTVQKYSERSVNVLGSVKKAGRILFPAEGGMTLMDAISGAEGHDRLANLKAVKLTRRNGNGEASTESIDVTQIIQGLRGDVTLQPGDHIFIPERIL